MKNKKWHKNKIDISTNFKWFVLKKKKRGILWITLLAKSQKYG